MPLSNEEPKYYVFCYGDQANLDNDEVENPKNRRMIVNLCPMPSLKTLRQKLVTCAGQTKVLPGIVSVNH